MVDEDESVPYIEKPDVKDDDLRNGLMCFMDADRECGPDCMAYSTFASESPYLNQQQKNCSLIVGVERLGRYAGGIMKIIKDTKHDNERSKGNIPDPMGGGT